MPTLKDTADLKHTYVVDLASFKLDDVIEGLDILVEIFHYFKSSVKNSLTSYSVEIADKCLFFKTDKTFELHQKGITDYDIECSVRFTDLYAFYTEGILLSKEEANILQAYLFRAERLLTHTYKDQKIIEQTYIVDEDVLRDIAITKYNPKDIHTYKDNQGTLYITIYDYNYKRYQHLTSIPLR